jgi:hypothetical protein
LPDAPVRAGGEGPLRAAIRRHALVSDRNSPVPAAAREIARLGGGFAVGIIFFGSRKTRPTEIRSVQPNGGGEGEPRDQHAAPGARDPWSAYDFFVVVSEYAGFYRSLRAAGHLHRPAWLLAALNAVMPPNQISLRVPAAGESVRAKCAVISLVALRRETGAERRDHFSAGRLFQPAEVVYAKDAGAEESLLDALVSAHAATFEWSRPFLPRAFDAAGYAEALLRISFRHEIRPEPLGRADTLFEAQRAYHREVYGVLLRELERRGELVPADGGYALARPVTRLEWLARSAYFRLSLVRATARWAKHMLTVDDWLDYIAHKAMRHTGQRIVLTERERRLPIVFLWPRVIRYLRGKDRR